MEPQTIPPMLSPPPSSRKSSVKDNKDPAYRGRPRAPSTGSDKTGRKSEDTSNAALKFDNQRETSTDRGFAADSATDQKRGAYESEARSNPIIDASHRNRFSDDMSKNKPTAIGASHRNPPYGDIEKRSTSAGAPQINLPHRDREKKPTVEGSRAGKASNTGTSYGQPPHTGVRTKQPYSTGVPRNVTYDQQNIHLHVGTNRIGSTGKNYLGHIDGRAGYGSEYDHQGRRTDMGYYAGGQHVHDLQLQTDVDMPLSVADKAQHFEGLNNRTAFSHLQDSYQKSEKSGFGKWFDKLGNLVTSKQQPVHQSSLVHGDNTKSGFYNSIINQHHGDNYSTTTYNDEDYKCQSLKVAQPQCPDHKYVSGAELSWELPKKKKMINNLYVKITNSQGEVWRSNGLKNSSNKCVIDDKKLECGKKYQAAVCCKYPNENVASNEITFITRPAKPKDLKVMCMPESFTIKWLTETGNFDKHMVEIFDKDSGKLLVSRRAKEFEQECEFDVDRQKDVYIGREYKARVTSYKEDQENRSLMTTLFVGDENGPKEVKTEFITENKVKVTWKSPSSNFGFFSSNLYIVQVLTDGKPFRSFETTNTFQEFEGLKRGTTFTFRVCVKKQEGSQSLWVSSDSVKTKASSAKVERFNVQNNLENPATSFRCTWDPPTGVQGYKLKYQHGEKMWIVTLGSNCKEYIAYDLTPNTVYKVCIKADEDGYGPYTSTETIKTELGEINEACLDLDPNESDSAVVKYTKAPGATSHNLVLYSSSEEERPRTHTNDSKFNDLKRNCLYYAIVTPLYGNVKGKEKQTTEILTLPNVPFLTKNNFYCDKEYASSMFHITWKPEPNCIEDEIRVSCLDFEMDHPQILKRIKDRNTGEKQDIEYRCSRSGCKYQIEMRSRNKGGFSEWSKPFIYTTAPDNVCNISLEIEKDGITAMWNVVPNTEEYKITLFEIEPNGKWNDLYTKYSSGRNQKFSFKPEHGFPYVCEITPINSTGEGEKTQSDIAQLPLDPPQGLTFEDTEDGIIFSWKKSVGMTSAAIQLTDFEHFEVREKTNATSWSPDILYDGTSYCFKVWARNGLYCSKEPSTVNFASAPSDIIVKRNKNEPETCLDVEIVSKHSGPFELTINGKENSIFHSRHGVLRNRKPATTYVIGVQSIFGNNQKTSVTEGRPVTTLPAKVTEVKCEPIKDTTDVLLKWEDCGNPNINYKIIWSKKYVPFQPIICRKTEQKFIDLQPGSYEFKVSAGGGVESDPCFVTIPESTKINLEILTKKAIHVTCTPVSHAEKYLFKIYSDELEELKSFNSREPEIWIDENKFNFEIGSRYQLSVQACWKEHCSLPMKEYFYTGLLIPDELKIDNDKKVPTRKALCTWKNSPGMLRAKIEVLDMNRNVVKELETSDLSLKLKHLKSNHTYKVKIWPGDGKMFFFDCCAKSKFTTAPDPPEKVTATQNLQNPQECVDIKVFSNYSGPFVIHLLDNYGNIVKGPITTKEKAKTITGLQPGASYSIHAQCKFKDYLTPKTYSSGSK